jgi:radical SAM protein with 4Fe4S-binding SPASM domain
VAENLVDRGLTLLQVSMDDHEKIHYEHIRVGASYDRVVENIRYLMEYRKKKGSRYPILMFNCILARFNIERVSDYLDFISRLGAEAVDFRHLVTFEGYGFENETLNLHKRLANRYFDIIRKKCGEIGIHIGSMPENFALSECAESVPSDPGDSRVPEPCPGIHPVKDDPPQVIRSDRVCTLPLSFIYVLPNGDVRPCCFWYDEKPLGNLFETDFFTLWNSTDYARLRDELSQGIFRRPCCQTCPALGSGSVDEEGAFVPKKI